METFKTCNEGFGRAEHGQLRDLGVPERPHEDAPDISCSTKAAITSTTSTMAT